jgi:hypothetical protein
MDPTANLKEQIELAKIILDEDDRGILPTDGARLAELVISLNRWMRLGGHLPEQWAVPRRKQPN